MKKIKLWIKKWTKRLLFVTLVVGLAYGGIYFYARKIVKENLLKRESKVEIQIPWSVLWEKKQIPQNDVTRSNARRIVSYAQNSPIAWYDMLAIASHESLLWDMDGDSGCSRGVFHINWCENNDISKKEAISIKKSLKWVEEKLLERGYKNDRFRAVGMHNGGTWANKQYAYDVLRTANIMRSKLLK